MSDRDPLIDLATEMGTAVGEVEERIFELDRRLTETETALCDLVIGLEREISELWRRLEQMEARYVGLPPPGLTLISEAA